MVAGFLTDNAASFNALLVYIEHRYYGKSIPHAFKSTSTIGFFNSAQAIADYAQVIIHIKRTLHAKKSPVIVTGASYGGMLAAWFRLKYPHLAIGALASSTPIMYFENITPHNAYYDVVTSSFREVSQTCYETIRKSWTEIDRVASQPNGLSILSRQFNTCRPLNNSTQLKDNLVILYASVAQYNGQQGRIPSISEICGAIDGASVGSDILTRINAGFEAFLGNKRCKVNGHVYIDESEIGWNWQTCSEMVMPKSKGNDSMFQPQPFNLKLFAKNCKKQFGVSPRPHWVTTYYGGHDIKLVLQRFASNIIFSNGLKDPYSSGSVVENISDSLVAINTVNGSHCMDILSANEDDPEWLLQQRKEEIEIIKGWITQYYADLGEVEVMTSKFKSIH